MLFVPSAFGRWGAALLLAALSTGASAQVTPTRAYFGIGRTMPFRVVRPVDLDGDIALRLFDSFDGAAVASASAAAGGVDLAGLFPLLAQRAEPRVMWLQLFVGDAAIGAPVVLRPMIAAERAVAISAGGAVVFDTDRSTAAAEARSDSFSGWSAYVDRRVDLETTEGVLTLRLRPDAAPNTCRHFLELVDGGLYTDVVFHRVAAGGDPDARFVVQAGDPAGTGLGGSGRFVLLERSPIEHDYGVVSLARGAHPDSGDAQFFIGLSRTGTRHLDGGYAAFAEVVAGAEVLERIARAETDSADRPFDPPLIRSASSYPAPPHGQGPGRIEPPAPVAVER